MGYNNLMWHREYRDYPPDSPLKKQRVGQGKGLIGCEMHEPNGWGETFHVYPEKKEGMFSRFLKFFKGKK